MGKRVCSFNRKAVAIIYPERTNDEKYQSINFPSYSNTSMLDIMYFYLGSTRRPSAAQHEKQPRQLSGKHADLRQTNITIKTARRDETTISSQLRHTHTSYCIRSRDGKGGRRGRWIGDGLGKQRIRGVGFDFSLAIAQHPSAKTDTRLAQQSRHQAPNEP